MPQHCRVGCEFEEAEGERLVIGRKTNAVSPQFDAGIAGSQRTIDNLVNSSSDRSQKMYEWLFRSESAYGNLSLSPKTIKLSQNTAHENVS
jgi:hypothetical protein